MCLLFASHTPVPALYSCVRLLLTLIHLIDLQVSAEADLSDAQLEASIPLFLRPVFRLCRGSVL